MLEVKAVRVEVPADANIIIGQSHFIKTVEDLYEAVATTVPQAKFGLAFNEASGACLTRSEGNDQTLRDTALRNAQALARAPAEVLRQVGLRSCVYLVATECIPHQCDGRDPQRARSMFHILRYRQPRRNYRRPN